MGLTSSKLKKLRDIKINSNGRCKRILLSVGASGGGGVFGTIVGSEANRRAFIRVLAETCHLFNFDGVDFNWEFPFWIWEVAGYAQLLMEAKEELSKDNLIVTAAINTDYLVDESALNTIDRVHVMSYDKPGDHSTYNGAVDDVTLLLYKGVLPEKIFLGVPFYARDRNIFHVWKFGPEYISIVANYSMLYSRLIPSGQDVYQGKLNGVDVDIYFNGITTIKKKTDYVLAKKLGGIMIWELAQDTDFEKESTSLLRAINESMGIAVPAIQAGAVVLNNSTFSKGEALSANFVLNESVDTNFTAYSVIILPSNKARQSGAMMINTSDFSQNIEPVATNVPGLNAGFRYNLISLSIPEIAPLGEYEIVTAFFDASKPITGRQDAFLDASVHFTVE